MKKLIAFFIAAIMLAASLITAIPAGAASTGFSDVAETRWSASAIKYAVYNGYMNGVGDGKFDPTGSLTRAMVATVLWRREGSPAPAAQSGFSDVPAGAWYADAVAWAKETGVVNGMTETTFAPNAFITREQLAAMLFRFSSSAPVSVPERADLSPFADDEKASGWAKESLEWAVEAGLINGTDGNRLAPSGNATREQFAAIIERYDGTFTLAYNEPVLKSHYTEKPYPLVDDADFYVSTAGSDENDGSFARPFRTWERARDAVRALDRTGRTGIKVAFMAGNYGPLELTLTEEDSGTPECPITYCKYGDGDVVFNNGFDCEVSDFVDISDEERSLFAEKFADGIKKADVSSVFDATENPDAIRVYYNGGMMTKARFPNKYLDGSDNLPPTAETVDETHLLIFFSLMYKRLEKYSERCFETMEIWGHIVRGYRKDTFKIVGYDSETRLMEVGQSSTDEFGGHLRVDEGLWMGADGKGVDMCFSNVPYELDFEGEYWIDPTTKTLYVYKPEGTYFIPGPGTMVTMDHADDVTFRGLCFRASEERFIYAHMCHGVTLELCEFNGTAATEGVYFDDNSAQRPMDLTVRECTFSNTYGHALFVNGHNIGEHKFEKSTGVVFDNNLVQTTNIAYDVWNGIHFNHCTDVAVTHNRFEECRRGAVSFNQSSGLLVEYNDFDSAMCDSNDGGVIYTDWICDGRDLVVRYNYFGKVESAGAGQYGLYLDEFSSGFDICSNLFYDTGSCAAMFSLGRDNTFRENVILYGSACDWGTSTRNEIEEAGSPEEAGRQGSWGINYGKLTWTEFFDNCKYPPYRQVIEERWPDMLNIHFEYDNIDDPYFALNQVTYVIGNAAVSKSADRSIFTTGRKYEKIYAHYENNATYTTDENPIFVNPTLGDYRIREDSGFPDIHFESIGRY